MEKRKINFFIIIGLGIFCIVSSIISIIEDLKVDLSKANSIVGKVTYAEVRNIQNFTLRRTTYKRIFYFALNNSDQKFAIQRFDEIYDEFSLNIKVGDTLKVYYRLSSNEYNTHVFQVEKSSRILADYRDYNTEVSTKTGMLIFIGIFIVISAIMWYKRLNIFKLMMSLVNSKTNKK